MELLNQKIGQNSLSLPLAVSSSLPLVRKTLFNKNAKLITPTLRTSKKNLRDQNLTTQNTQWTSTAKIAAIIISSFSAGSYFTYQYLTKSAPLKVVTPFSLINPIRTILISLLPIGVVALVTKLVQSNRLNEVSKRSNFNIKKAYGIQKERESSKSLPKSNFQDSSVINVLKNDPIKGVVELARDLITLNPDAAFPIISLLAAKHPKEVYPLIEPVLLKNEKLNNNFLKDTIKAVMESLNSRIDKFFSDENSQTNKISLEQILDIIQPYILNEHSFADDFYYEFMTHYRLSSWKFASLCIGNKSPVAKEIVEIAIRNLFIKEQNDSLTAAATQFVVKWIQLQREEGNQDESISVNLQILYSKLYDKTKLEETIKDAIQVTHQEVATTMIFLALIMHGRKDLIPLIDDEYKDLEDFDPDQNELSTNRITNSEHNLT